ncbi:hypothetical protein [Nakamurella sp.]|uniref:hypothetical protein n=1 Tax=Nakamurella sp. TaxID=1869182 RepID=UPI003783BE74
MTMVGADLDELERLAAVLDEAAGETRRIEWLASSRLFVAEWAGADIDDVRLRWNSGCRPGLRRTTESLHDAARQIRQQAEQQRRASDAGWYYTRSITDRRAIAEVLGDWWNGAIGVGRSFLQTVGRVTGNLLVGLGSLALDGASAVARVAAGIGQELADAGRSIFDDVVVPALERDLFELYDWAAALPLVGELVEQTAGVVPADSLVGGVGGQLDVSRIYDNLADNYGGPGHIEVQTVRGADGQLRYVVYIPGTQEWLPGTNNPADVMSDLEVGGLHDDTPLSIAVERAIKASGVPDGAALVLAGHSLGGLTAVQMSRDPDFTARYQVEGVFTAGAGTDNTAPPAGVQFQALRHYNDIVSWLGDSEPIATVRPGQQEHWSFGPSAWSPLDNHNMPGYQNDARHLQDQGAFAATENALSGFFGPGSTVVDTHGYEARKLPIIGDDPRIVQAPASAGGKAA